MMIMNKDPETRPAFPDAATELLPIVRDSETISLAGLDEMKAGLLSRTESKHLMTLPQCRDLVRRLAGSYRVLDIAGTRIGRYETLYYDTVSFLTYLQHHNGKGTRYKLRLRHYESSGETYLEVKKKTNKGATEKSRIRTRWSTPRFSPEQVEFLRSALPYDVRGFVPMITTEYYRLTLVSDDAPERITFDSGITFRAGERAVSYPRVVIGEIKYEKGTRNSPARAALRSMGIPSQGFSKYCIGVSLLYRQVKHNRFKPKLLFLSRFALAGGEPC